MIDLKQKSMIKSERETVPKKSSLENLWKRLDKRMIWHFTKKLFERLTLFDTHSPDSVFLLIFDPTYPAFYNEFGSLILAECPVLCGLTDNHLILI